MFCGGPVTAMAWCPTDKGTGVGHGDQAGLQNQQPWVGGRREGIGTILEDWGPIDGGRRKASCLPIAMVL